MTTRRDLMKAAGLAAGLAWAGDVATSAAAASKTGSKEPADGDDLTWAPGWKIRDMVAAGEISAVEVVTHFLQRIEDLDGKLHAFKVVDRNGALAQAEIADRARVAGEPLGPLHGVPVSLKEHIPLAGFPNTGVGVADGPPSTYDYVAVERLKKAGAIIIGKNTMMLTGGAPMNAPNWDREARNPWDLGRVPGWSSSGCAAAAAARLTPIAIGGDGAGSIRTPSAFTGLVGLHPTRGRIPHVSYTAPYLLLNTTIGPMARDCRDVAIALGVMAGPDGRDFVCMQDAPPDYAAGLARGVRGLRIVWTENFGFTPKADTEIEKEVVRTIRAAVDGMSAFGVKVRATDTVWENPSGLSGVTSAVYDQGVLGTGVRLEGGRAIPSSAVMPTIPPTEEKYRAAVELRARNIARFREIFSQADLIICPTSNTVAPKVDEYVEHRRTRGYTNTAMFNWIGFPAMNVPCGLVDGLPVGMQIAGPPGSEDVMLRLAAAFMKHAGLNLRPAIGANG